MIRQAINKGKALKAPHGHYIFWSPGAGIELWVPLNEKWEIVGCSPHFSGSSRIRMRITDLTQDAEIPLEGSLQAIVESEGYDDLYHPVIDLPDFDLVRDRWRSLPFTATVQLAAFAYYLNCFKRDADFYASQEQESLQFAAESFLPIGLFSKLLNPSEAKPMSTKATAILAGHVQLIESRVNPATGRSFYYLSVQMRSTAIDMVADPTIVTGELVTGGVIQGTFWLSGRVISDLPLAKQSSILTRLFRRLSKNVSA